jgi:hypothetical protein
VVAKNREIPIDFLAFCGGAFGHAVSVYRNVNDPQKAFLMLIDVSLKTGDIYHV